MFEEPDEIDKWNHPGSVNKSRYQDLAAREKEHVCIQEGPSNFQETAFYEDIVRKTLSSRPERVGGGLQEYYDKLPGDILNKVFYVIDFEASYTISGGSAVPCEVGICRFNLAQGELGRYHHFIDPGEIPEEVARVEAWARNKLHGIQEETYSPFDKNYDAIYSDILQFVKGDILFAKGKNMEIMCLHWLAKKCQKDDRFFVHEIDALFKIMFGNYVPRPSFYELYETRVAGFSKCDFHANLTPDHLKGEMCSYDKGDFHCALADARVLCSIMRYAAAQVSLILPGNFFKDFGLTTQTPIVIKNQPRVCRYCQTPGHGEAQCPTKASVTKMNVAHKGFSRAITDIIESKPLPPSINKQGTSLSAGSIPTTGGDPLAASPLSKSGGAPTAQAQATPAAPAPVTKTNVTQILSKPKTVGSQPEIHIKNVETTVRYTSTSAHSHSPQPKSQQPQHDPQSDNWTQNNDNPKQQNNQNAEKQNSNQHGKQHPNQQSADWPSNEKPPKHQNNWGKPHGSQQHQSHYDNRNWGQHDKSHGNQHNQPKQQTHVYRLGQNQSKTTQAPVQSQYAQEQRGGPVNNQPASQQPSKPVGPRSNPQQGPQKTSNPTAVPSSAPQVVSGGPRGPKSNQQKNAPKIQPANPSVGPKANQKPVNPPQPENSSGPAPKPNQKATKAQQRTQNGSSQQPVELPKESEESTPFQQRPNGPQPKSIQSRPPQIQDPQPSTDEARPSPKSEQQPPTRVATPQQRRNNGQQTPSLNPSESKATRTGPPSPDQHRPSQNAPCTQVASTGPPAPVTSLNPRVSSDPRPPPNPAPSRPTQQNSRAASTGPPTPVTSPSSSRVSSESRPSANEPQAAPVSTKPTDLGVDSPIVVSGPATRASPCQDPQIESTEENESEETTKKRRKKKKKRRREEDYYYYEAERDDYWEFAQDWQVDHPDSNDYWGGAGVAVHLVPLHLWGDPTREPNEPIDLRSGYERPREQPDNDRNWDDYLRCENNQKKLRKEREQRDKETAQKARKAKEDRNRFYSEAVSVEREKSRVREEVERERIYQLHRQAEVEKQRETAQRIIDLNRQHRQRRDKDSDSRYMDQSREESDRYRYSHHRSSHESRSPPPSPPRSRSPPRDRSWSPQNRSSRSSFSRSRARSRSPPHGVGGNDYHSHGYSDKDRSYDRDSSSFSVPVRYERSEKNSYEHESRQRHYPFASSSEKTHPSDSSLDFSQKSRYFSKQRRYSDDRDPSRSRGGSIYPETQKLPQKGVGGSDEIDSRQHSFRHEPLLHVNKPQQPNTPPPEERPLPPPPEHDDNRDRDRALQYPRDGLPNSPQKAPSSPSSSSSRANSYARESQPSERWDYPDRDYDYGAVPSLSHREREARFYDTRDLSDYRRDHSPREYDARDGRDRTSRQRDDRSSQRTPHSPSKPRDRPDYDPPRDRRDDDRRDPRDDLGSSQRDYHRDYARPRSPPHSPGKRLDSSHDYREVPSPRSSRYDLRESGDHDASRHRREDDCRPSSRDTPDAPPHSPSKPRNQRDYNHNQHNDRDSQRDAPPRSPSKPRDRRDYDDRSSQRDAPPRSPSKPRDRRDYDVRSTSSQRDDRGSWRRADDHRTSSQREQNREGPPRSSSKRDPNSDYQRVNEPQGNEFFSRSSFSKYSKYGAKPFRKHYIQRTEISRLSGERVFVTVDPEGEEKEGKILLTEGWVYDLQNGVEALLTKPEISSSDSEEEEEGKLDASDGPAWINHFTKKSGSLAKETTPTTKEKKPSQGSTKGW